MYSTQSGIKRAKKHMNQYLVHDVAESNHNRAGKKISTVTDAEETKEA